MNQISIFEPHFGSVIDFRDSEILAIAHIDRKLLAKEAKLYGVKWFDYRPMHPTQATYLMVHYYNQAYGRYMDVTKDHGKRFMVGFKGKDFMFTREKQSFWRLRQLIDDLGIRYDFFCREAMNWCVAHGWRQPPRPAHITTNAELILDVTNLWAEECRAKIQFARQPRFTAAAFVAAPDQLAYEAWLVEQIMQRPHPKFALHSALYLFDALRIETAIARLPAQAVSAALQISLV